ncbi:hypothetical protein [Alkalispirochaeta alkalica]|uniref:hypothetical protein n=1 Tax=Alkalispirochaeta alkalica TaxID=46356 RepID=UPI0014613566|nr:hypothetical protein [Alkalispirochaeta alkalica]
MAGSYITYEARKSGASPVDQSYHSLALTPSETAAILTILYEAFSRQARMDAEAHILPEDIPAGDFFTEAFREAVKKEIAPTPKPESEGPHDEDPDETPDNSDPPGSREGN